MTLQSGIAMAARVAPVGRRVDAHLNYGVSAGKTYLSRQLTPYPFHITRPFYVAGDPDGMATLYLQSCSGGLYGDDDLRLGVSLDPRAQAHLTTQASTVVPAARGGVSRLNTVLTLEAGSLLEYCPDPAILLPEARLRTTLTARRGEGAHLFAADSILTHDPAGQSRPFEHVLSEVRLEDANGTPVLIDRQAVNGTDWAGRMDGFGCYGTVLVAPDAGLSDMAALLEKTLNDLPGVYGGLSRFDDRGALLARFLAPDGVALSAALTALWSAARTCRTGHPPAPRRK